MSWLEAIWLAEVHRETYIAILKSWIPHGLKGDFARRAGLSPEYLSYLCALDRPARDHFPLKRLPSPEMAERIADALPAPAEIRQSLIENMELAHTHAAHSYYVTREFVSQRQITELLSEIGIVHQQATFGSVLHEVKRAYRVVRDLSVALIPLLSPKINPASFIQACLYLHDAQCILDRADDALRYAKVARLVAENVDVYEQGFSRAQVDDLEINAIRGEAVAYHNLGLDREVPRLYEWILATPAYRNAGDFWIPLVGRDLLNSMAVIPRSGIRKATQIAGEIETVCERKGDEFTLFLVRESWLRSLILHEKWIQAQQVFQEEMERIPNLPYIGALHRATLLKSGALLAWNRKDRGTWQLHIREALTLMQKAGLKHQMRQVQQIYGAAIKTIFENTNLFPGNSS
jgi:hypothetical protein